VNYATKKGGRRDQGKREQESQAGPQAGRKKGSRNPKKRGKKNKNFRVTKREVHPTKGKKRNPMKKKKKCQLDNQPSRRKENCGATVKEGGGRHRGDKLGHDFETRRRTLSKKVSVENRLPIVEGERIASKEKKTKERGGGKSRKKGGEGRQCHKVMLGLFSAGGENAPG